MTRTLVDASIRWEPHNQLLTELVDRVAAEIPNCLGTTLTIRHGGGPPSVLATHGVSQRLAPAQLQHGGPIADAAGSGDSASTDDLFADERWPALTRDALIEVHPALTDRWQRIRGVVALARPWGHDGTLVLSAALEGPATPGAWAVLGRYEKLTAGLLVVVEAAAVGNPDQVLALLASRATIEQAKGAIMAARGCDVDEAWNTLRQSSQEFNVKVRDLAVALVELLGDTEVHQPEGTPPVHPDESAREAARRLWRTFTTSPQS